MRRRSIYLLPFLALSILSAGASWSAESSPSWVIVVRPKADAVKSGALLTIYIQAINTSDRTIGIRTTSAWYDWDVVVRDSQGNVVPYTKKGLYLSDDKKGGGPLATVRNFFQVLTPGDGYTDEINVAALYDMRRPGRYFIQVQRENTALIWVSQGRRPDDDPTHALVKSKTVGVTVTE